jgi:2'-hydroxyisoflavone reductase
VAASLQPHLPHWVFVSSISVVARFPPGQPHDETAPVTDQSTGYGGEKARAEETLRALCADRAAVVRPGLIVGRHDPTGRFAYWPWRLAQGGTVLAPGRPERPVQFIDAEDLAAWCIRLAETRQTGTFNAVGPPVSMGTLLETCRDASGTGARLVWRPDADLLAAGVPPWTGLPLWLPEQDRDFGGMLLARSDRAVAAGLRARPLPDTVADVLNALRADPARATFPNVISPELEARLVDGA